MTSVEILADLVTTLANGIHKEVAGLSVPELTWQPDAEGNSIGVTVWHISRGLDVLKVRFLEQQPAEAEQWYTQGWARKTAYDHLDPAIGTYRHSICSLPDVWLSQI